MRAPEILSLAQHAERLVRWVASRHALPPFERMVVLDTSQPSVKWASNGWQLPASALQDIAACAPRFDEYLRAGHSWVNMSLYGLHGTTLVLGIELPPRGPTGTPAGFTSVNYSGPSLESTTNEPRWRLSLTILPDDRQNDP